MLYDFVNGATSVVLRIKLRDSSLTTGAGLTGLTSSSTGLVISTIADNESTATAYAVASSKVETITTLGTYAAPTATKCRFKEVDSTNHKGLYEIQIADARFAVASAKSLTISFSGAANLAECDVVIPLRAVNPYDAVRGGMTALPNAAANANGGLPILSSSGTALAYTVTTVTTVGTTTTLTNLPAITTDWLSAAGVSAAAVTKIQTGLATPTNITAGTITNATNVTNRVTANADQIAGSATAATALETQMGAQNIATVNDVSPAVGSFKGASSLSATNDEYTGQILALASGTQAGIARKITGYTGSTRLFAFATPFPAAPANGDSFIVISFTP